MWDQAKKPKTLSFSFHSKPWKEIQLVCTSVADYTHRWRGEDEDASAEESQLPEYHDLLSKETDELGHAACWMGDLLQIQRHKSASTCPQINLNTTIMRVADLSNLHLRVHAVIDRSSPCAGR